MLGEKYTLDIRPTFIDELDRAVAYIEQHLLNPIAADKLVSDVYEAIDQTLAHPLVTAPRSVRPTCGSRITRFKSATTRSITSSTTTSWKYVGSAIHGVSDLCRRIPLTTAPTHTRTELLHLHAHDERGRCTVGRGNRLGLSVGGAFERHGQSLGRERRFVQLRRSLHAQCISEPCSFVDFRIRDAIDRTVGKFTKAQLLETCPDIRETTMERTLKQLLDARFIRKIGAGRGSAYCKT